MNKIVINWPDFSEIINDAFVPLMDNTSRYLICAGGRGCFGDKQEVLTKDGVKYIKDIVVGDIVPSYNELNGNKEFNRVLNVFKYDVNEPVYKINLFSGSNIIVTFDHKFLYKNNWVEIRKIIDDYDRELKGRDLEEDRRVREYTSYVRDKQHGETTYQQLEGNRSNKNNETSKRREWLFKNRTSWGKWKQTSENTQACSGSFYTKSRKKSYRKSQELYKRRQQSIKLRVDGPHGEYNGCLQQWEVCNTSWGADRKPQSNGETSNGNKKEVQTKSLYKKNASIGVQSNRGYSETNSTKEYLETCDIKSYEIINNIKEVYDFEVEDNHNFYLKTNSKDILVHNSGKSVFAAAKFVYKCASPDYFRGLLVRKSFNSIKDSSYEEIKTTIIDLGLAHLFEFKLQPLEIIFIPNGNKIIARGCDDTTKLKSLKDITDCWVEEDVLSEEDFITITSSIRTSKGKYLQEIYTINPEVEGNYQDHWFYKRFFEGHSDKSYTDVRSIDIGDGQRADITYTVHHSTYKDNKYIPNSFIAYLKELKVTNPYYYEVYANGNWGNKQLGGLAYKRFVRGTHCDTSATYNPDLALHISFDFNVKPYMSLVVAQIEGKQLRVIETIATKSPDNTTRGICREFSRRYPSHKSGLFIYGDPSGKNEDTKMENGYNNYSIIEEELTRYRPDVRVATKHPPIVMRLMFINSIFHEGFNGMNIMMHDEKCPELLNDLMFQKEASDGTKLKEKITKGGETYEKYGHMSDALDYLICEAFSEEFREYTDGPQVDIRYTAPLESNFNAQWGY